MNVQSRMLPLWLVVLLAWNGVSHADDWSHMCGNDFDVALGQHTVTHAQVIGAPGEQLPMHPSYPVEKDPYLISGDHIELVTTCDAYAFVRFQGHSRVSAGWVEQSRLKITGKPYVPLPRNASTLCKTAQDLLNKSDSLNGLAPLDMKPASPAEEKALGTNENSGVIDRVVRLNIGGRTIAAVTSAGGGGTCDTQDISLWSADLSANIDAPDGSARNPFHDTDSDSWGFGNEASLINLLGEPMVLSRNNAGDRFYLSSIQSNGDIRPVCEGVATPAARERLTVAMDGKLCGAFVEGKGTLIELHPPLPAETLSVQTPDPALSFSKPMTLPYTPGWESEESPGGDRQHLYISRKGGGAFGNYVLEASGMADLNNSGHLHRIGMIQSDFDSSAGCGAQGTAEAPVLLDDKGNADPSTPINKGLYAALSSDLVPGITHTHLLRYVGSTYVEIVPGQGGTRNEIWKVDREGPHLLCRFHSRDYEVKPLRP